MHVRIFTTTNCPACNAVKRFLKNKNIQFKEIDVEDDIDAAREMIEISGQMAVPVLDMNGKIIVGFNRDAIESAIG